VYGAIRAFTILVKTLLTRSRVVGLEHIPRTGGVLVVSNHASNADPVVLMAVAPRPLVFMTKVELFQNWASRTILEAWRGAFPVERGKVDVRAVRDALALLHAGAAVVVFPEGTRQPDGLERPHRGIGYIAARASCPVLPVALVGTDAINGLWDLRKRPAFEVRFGVPFRVPPDDPGDLAADRIMRAVAALLPTEKRGAYRAEAQPLLVP
jgi:1-acyl-sn-glycerol-3-phosphate acyltransferase